MSGRTFPGGLFSIATVNMMPIALRLRFAMLVGGFVAAIFGLLIACRRCASGRLPRHRDAGLRRDHQKRHHELDFTGGALALDTSGIYSKRKTLLPFAIILVFITTM